MSDDFFAAFFVPDELAKRCFFEREASFHDFSFRAGRKGDDAGCVWRDSYLYGEVVFLLFPSNRDFPIRRKVAGGERSE